MPRVKRGGHRPRACHSSACFGRAGYFPQCFAYVFHSLAVMKAGELCLPRPSPSSA